MTWLDWSERQQKRDLSMKRYQTTVTIQDSALKKMQSFLSLQCFTFSGTKLCIWRLWSSCCYSLLLKLREMEGGSFRGSPARGGRVLSEEFLGVLPFSHCWTIGYWAEWGKQHPKLHIGYADAINSGSIQLTCLPATVAETHGVVQMSHQMTHVTMSCCLHRKLLKISYF